MTPSAANERRLEDSMNARNGAMLGLAIVMGGWTSFLRTQEAAIPFGQVEKDTQFSARLALPGTGTASSLYSSSLSPAVASLEPSTAGFTRVPPVEIHRTLGSSFYLLNGLHLSMAVFDVEMTQHCIANHHCREGNPLMPSSQVGALSMNLALVGYGSWVSYRMKRHHARN